MARGKMTTFLATLSQEWHWGTGLVPKCFQTTESTCFILLSWTRPMGSSEFRFDINFNSLPTFYKVSNQESYEFSYGDYAVTVETDSNDRPILTTIQGTNANGDTFLASYQPLVPNLKFTGPVQDISTFNATLNSVSFSGRGWSEYIGGDKEWFWCLFCYLN